MFMIVSVINIIITFYDHLGFMMIRFMPVYVSEGVFYLQLKRHIQV